MWAHMARRYAWAYLGRCVLVPVCPRDGAQDGDLYTGALVLGPVRRGVFPYVWMCTRVCEVQGSMCRNT